MVCKQRKYALKQASFVIERFIEQFVVDVNITRLPLNIRIKRDILDQFQAHFSGKLHVRCAVVIVTDILSRLFLMLNLKMVHGKYSKRVTDRYLDYLIIRITIHISAHCTIASIKNMAADQLRSFYLIDGCLALIILTLNV